MGIFSDQRKQKAGKTLFGSLGVKEPSLFSLPTRETFGVAFCYKDCFGDQRLRLHSAQRVDWMTVEAAVSAA